VHGAMGSPKQPNNRINFKIVENLKSIEDKHRTYLVQFSVKELEFVTETSARVASI
jgi:hypothetical protein